jgi:hypothetical protein
MLDAPQVAWQGSSWKLRFEGTGLCARLDAGMLRESFRVVVDGDHTGSHAFAVAPRPGLVSLVEGLPPGQHTVELVRESYAGSSATFYGAKVLGGSPLPPAARPPHRLLFFGDSNLAGDSLGHEENHASRRYVGVHLGLSGIAARMLDAEYHNIAVSGATLGDVLGMAHRVDWWSPTPVWDDRLFEPEVVVLNAGANNVGSPVPTIRAHYHALLDDLRSAYPTAHIVVFNGWGWDFDEPANYTADVVAERGDPNMVALTFPWVFEQWHGCETDHAGMANVLAHHIGEVMGWPVAEPSVPSGFGVDGDVANGGFEEVAPFGGFGWRYQLDPGVERVFDPPGSHGGDHHLRLEDGASVHQPNPVAPGEQVVVQIWLRGAEADQVGVQIDFRDQQMGTEPLAVAPVLWTLTPTWTLFRHSATAPAGGPRPPFHTRLTLTAGPSSTVDVDDISMTAL